MIQSTLGGALTASWRRFGGTVLGATAGALLSNYFRPNLAMFGVGVFLLGLVCAILRLGTAYRFAGVTLAIIMLIVRDKPAWIVAEHRFIEVSVGIAVGLVVTAVWPLQERKRRGCVRDSFSPPIAATTGLPMRQMDRSLSGYGLTTPRIREVLSTVYHAHDSSTRKQTWIAIGWSEAMLS